jgi:glycosyltransferase involved in cell wall biosynthesis/2-polyprenyl-3-methyl-5-hydroxy-6-metoxy-1,4-benzoquinol methylase
VNDERRRKLLHVTSACTVGGCEGHVLALLGALDAARYERWLAYFEERPDEARPLLADFQALGIRTVDLRGRGRLDPLAVLRLYSLLRRERFDLVHTHSLRAELAAAVATRFVSPRPRLVRTVHNVDDFYLRPPTSWLARWSAHSLDAIIAISDAVADHVKAHPGAPVEKITRIYYGIDAAPYTLTPALSQSEREFALPISPSPHPPIPPSPIPHRPTIGMVARLAPQKGHKVLLDALPAVIALVPDLRVELVGHEHLTSSAELRAYAERLGVAQHVRFLGYRDVSPALLHHWRVFVLPSLWEGFGLVLLEAMAAGKPVAASRVGPIPEIVLHGETGLLVEPGQPDSLAAALIELLENPERAARLGAAGRQRVADHFTLEKMVAETERLYVILSESKESTKHQQSRVLDSSASPQNDSGGSPPRPPVSASPRPPVSASPRPPGARSLVYVPCPACGTRDSIWVADEYGLGVRRCLHCDLIYVSPRLSEPQQHYHGERDSILAKYGAILRGEKGHNRDPNYRQELAVLARLKPTGKLLDVGAHCGFFLRMARGMGWELHGVEPSPAAELAREFFGLEVHRGHVEELGFPDESFDLVTLIDVLEHIDRPPKLLAEVRRLLKPDGLVFVKTPNARYNLFKLRLFHQTLGLQDVEIFDAKEHVAHYSRETLGWLLGKAGFEVTDDFVPRPVQDGDAWKCALRSTAYALARAQHTVDSGKFGPLATDLAVVARKRSKAVVAA